MSAAAPDPGPLEAARRAFETGQLQKAAQACRDLLALRPRDVDLLCLLGEVEYKRGDQQAATECLDKAIGIDRRHARAQWLTGNIDQDRGNLDRAISAYRRALRAAPDLAEAHNDLGTAYFAKGWHQEAEQCYRRTLELQPENFAATENLAAVLRAQGKLREARDAFIAAFKLRVRSVFYKLFGRTPRLAHRPSADDKARASQLGEIRKLLASGQWAQAQVQAQARLDQAPNDADALFLLGRAEAAEGKHEHAIATLEQVLKIRTTTPEDYVALGNVLTDDGQYVRALENYKLALMLDPAHAPATANIARVLHERGHYREAEEIYRLSVEHDPDIAGAHSSLASTLISLGRFAEAEGAARRALEINPRSIHALGMLANALVEQQRIEEAQAVLRNAREIDPGHPQLLRWLAAFHMMLSADFERAETLLRQALRTAPQDSSLHINLARSLLVRERFQEGWEEYEWRRRDPSRAAIYTKFPYPDWDGNESLAGRSIVVNGEQGLGDEIMYASCLQELAASAQRCVVYCHRRLETLFRRSFPFAEVIGGSHLMNVDPFPVLPQIDFQVAAGSLPRTFRRSAKDFPRHTGYLRAEEEKIARWSKRVADLGEGLKIGLSWKGGTPLSDATRRTMTLQVLREVLALPGTQWISLQYGDCAAERESFASTTGIALHHWQEAVDDLEETAALMAALDLRISVCNTQVHISGALGKEVWVMTPLSPDWRYGCAGKGMQWYPAARMFRQPKYSDWHAVVEEVRTALEERLRP